MALRPDLRDLRGRRRPDRLTPPAEPGGLLFCLIGVLFASGELVSEFASDATFAWFGATAAQSSVFVVVLLLLFPTGHFLSPGWRRAGVTLIAANALVAIATGLDPGPLPTDASVSNPLGIDGAGPVLGPIARAAPAVLLSGLALGIAGVVARFRRARGLEREQLKWIAFAAGFGIAMLGFLVALSAVVDTDTGAGNVLAGMLLCTVVAAPPVAAAGAILRHRLYDIDLVINRAIVYGALTARLGAAYLGSVLLVSLAVGESGFAVAASTLAVAALFRPARARIQAGVDRRFYRRRYDATRTLEAFSGRLRDEVDLDALSGDLRRVIGQPMQPAQVSLWLREVP